MPPSALGNIHLVQPLFPAEHLGANLAAAKKVITSPNLLAAAVKISADEAKTANFTVSQPDATEALKVYNAVIADGRFIKEFNSDPAKVAQKLNMQLSAGAVAAIKTAATFKGSTFGSGGTAEFPTEVVCVTIIVLVLARAPQGDILVDRSGVIKI
jgi:hypothetical protein